MSSADRALPDPAPADLEALLNLPAYIFVLQRSELRISLCNDRFAQAIGSQRSEVQGRAIADVLAPDIAAHVLQQAQQVFEAGEPLRLEENLGFAAGQVEAHLIPLKQANGEVHALIYTCHDISERVQLRAALAARTQQLEAVSHELDALSYAISHDLRAPLRHISGFVGILRQQLEQAGRLTEAEATEAGIVRYVEILQESSQHMAQLMDGLLALSRIGRQPMQPRPTPLEPLVHQAIALIAAPPSTEFTVGTLPTVAADPILLQRALHHLLDNAVKFSRNQPRPQVAIGTLDDGTLFIRDNGVGFSMQYADQLFGAFQRLHPASEFEGLGLGLAIAQRIVHRHGGSIWAESEPNRGACFYLKL